MKNLKYEEIPKSIELWRVIAAYWSGPGYSEERVVLADLGEVEDNYVLDSRYVIIEYSHCSCFDFPEAEPDAVEYTEEELIKLAGSKIDSGTYYASERSFWKCILDAFEDED